jgi:hypothetical protein
MEREIVVDAKVSLEASLTPSLPQQKMKERQKWKTRQQYGYI